MSPAPFPKLLLSSGLANHVLPGFSKIPQLSSFPFFFFFYVCVGEIQKKVMYYIFLLKCKAEMRMRNMHVSFKHSKIALIYMTLWVL